MIDPTPEAYEAAVAKAIRCLEGAAANDGGIPAVARWLVGEVWDLAEATVRAKVAAEITDAGRDPLRNLAWTWPWQAARIAEGKGDAP